MNYSNLEGFIQSPPITNLEIIRISVSLSERRDEIWFIKTSSLDGSFTHNIAPPQYYVTGMGNYSNIFAPLSTKSTPQ